MKIKFAKDAAGAKLYPITIAAAVIDNVRNQRLSVTLANIFDALPTYATSAECETAAGELT